MFFFLLLLFMFFLWILCCSFKASVRNFGERTISIFNRKKKNTEQNIQDSANQIEDDAEEAAANIKNDANELDTNAGY